jgi:apolipoprotein N-acyltransferase
VSICYEDIIPGVVNVLMRGGPGHRVPEVMINVSDDSWFGNTIEPAQHLALASFRAIEHRRPLARSTPTGVSAIIDPAGRIVMRTEQWTKATLAGRIPIMEGRTIYAQLGDWIGWLCVALALSGLGWAWRLRRIA